MPKLNVQQNNQNVIQAFKNALAIGNLKGIIASDGNHNFSTSGSNPNLLDNAYFVGGGSQLGYGIFPINQRGQTSYTGGITGFDRWTVDGGDFTATLESGGVRVTSTTPYAGLSQILPAYKLQNGETYTYSIVVDGVLHTVTFVANSDGNWANIYYGEDWYVPYQFINGKWTFKIINTLTSNGMNHLISKAKIEKGTVSTLVNDAPPNFGEELEKCKRYLQRVKQPQGYTASVGFGMVGAASNILRTTIPLSSPLRNAASITATATNTGQMFVWGNGSYYSVTGVTGRTVLNGNAIVDITVNGTLENYKTYNLILNNADAYIDLSAEL